MKTQNKSGQAKSYSYFLGTYPISWTSCKQLQALQGGRKPDEPQSFSKCNDYLPLTNYPFNITMQSDNRQVHMLSRRRCSAAWEHRLSPAISQPLILKPLEPSSHISPLLHLSCFLSCPDLSSAVSADNQLGSGAVFPEVSYLSQQVGSLIKKKKTLTKEIHTSSSPFQAQQRVGDTALYEWTRMSKHFFQLPHRLSLSSQKQRS